MKLETIWGIIKSSWKVLAGVAVFIVAKLLWERMPKKHRGTARNTNAPLKPVIQPDHFEREVDYDDIEEIVEKLKEGKE